MLSYKIKRNVWYLFFCFSACVLLLSFLNKEKAKHLSIFLYNQTETKALLMIILICRSLLKDAITEFICFDKGFITSGNFIEYSCTSNRSTRCKTSKRSCSIIYNRCIWSSWSRRKYFLYFVRKINIFFSIKNRHFLIKGNIPYLL